jgi:hypothetical protein
MKKVYLILVMLFCVSTAWAAEYNYNVTIIWEHPGATDLKGFEYRINGDNDTITSIPGGGDVRSWSGVMSLDDGLNLIDLRAEDEAGQVSLWSGPVSYDPVPVEPVLTIMILE